MDSNRIGYRLFGGLRSGLRDQLAIGRRPLAAPRWLLSRWRRSLQTRVVTKAIVFSALIILVVGWLLLRQIGDGLAQRRAEFAVTDSSQAISDAVSRLNAVDARSSDAQALLAELTTLLTTRGAAQGYDVVVRGPLGVPTAPGAGTRLSPGIVAASVPRPLERAVERTSPGQSSWTFTTLSYWESSQRPPAPGVAVGALVQLPGNDFRYAVYFLFSLEAEEEAFGLVRQTLLTSGLILLFLIALLTALLSRQVVRPVRDARRVAERLAAGELHERLVTGGTDDLARLALSFNGMADSLEGKIVALEQMSDAQRRFVSDVSHELRTPLTTVRMATELLHESRAEFDAVNARSAELLHREVDRFDVLLAHLLEISRFDAGAATLRTSRFSMSEAVRSVMTSLETLAEVHLAHLDLHASAGDDELEADRMRVERILSNLLANAIDYADSSKVEVTVAGNQDAVAVLVQDYGIGLAAEDHERVFSRFWRADQSRDRATGGTGLGLSIAQEDARLHGGDLAAWGAVGRGSQFLLVLPRTPRAEIGQSPLQLGRPWW